MGGTSGSCNKRYSSALFFFFPFFFFLLLSSPKYTHIYVYLAGVSPDGAKLCGPVCGFCVAVGFWGRLAKPGGAPEPPGGWGGGLRLPRGWERARPLPPPAGRAQPPAGCFHGIRYQINKGKKEIQNRLGSAGKRGGGGEEKSCVSLKIITNNPSEGDDENNSAIGGGRSRRGERGSASPHSRLRGAEGERPPFLKKKLSRPGWGAPAPGGGWWWAAGELPPPQSPPRRGRSSATWR